MKFQSWILVALALSVAAKAVSAQTSAQGVEPTQYPGNDFINEQAPCYQMYQKGYINTFSDDMIGVKVEGFGPYSNEYVTTTITNSRFLSWTLTDAEMIGVIMKGGQNGHYLYNYEPFDFTNDQNLQCPDNDNGATPEISHYIMCYLPVTNGPTPDPQSCTRCIPVNTLNECTGETVPALALAPQGAQVAVDCRLAESVCLLAPVCEEVNGSIVCTCPQEICFGYIEGCEP